MTVDKWEVDALQAIVAEEFDSKPGNQLLVSGEESGPKPGNKYQLVVKNPILNQVINTKYKGEKSDPQPGNNWLVAKEPVSKPGNNQLLA